MHFLTKWRCLISIFATLFLLRQFMDATLHWRETASPIAIAETARMATVPVDGKTCPSFYDKFVAVDLLSTFSRA